MRSVWTDHMDVLRITCPQPCSQSSSSPSPSLAQVLFSVVCVTQRVFHYTMSVVVAVCLKDPAVFPVQRHFAADIEHISVADPITADQTESENGLTKKINETPSPGPCQTAT
ncbi:hypothetical protein F2P81_022331 [Scophthalmus maximus]|uniref:Uncharacterized protein n=1 Tax=Scophthalmus maximus TaxID=52904 RepID=A0A6A4S1E3_SCOMX|nr:hypothetical protein F2P81_022331 [Scophthalmus maximus]